MSKIYISHPFGGKEENKYKIEAIIRELVRDNPNNVYISPVHTFGYLYNDVSCEQGTAWCLGLLSICDIMWVFGDWEQSRGCNVEIDYCEVFGIRYEIID